jgi:ribosome-binding factor A
MKHRLKRVNELLKRELSVIITREITFQDALVTINHVDVTNDLKNAHVYVSVLGSGEDKVIEQLEKHRAMLQAQMARHVVLKYTPHLIFHLDRSIERGTRIIEILQEIEPPRGENESK